MKHVYYARISHKALIIRAFAFLEFEHGSKVRVVGLKMPIDPIYRPQLPDIRFFVAMRLIPVRYTNMINVPRETLIHMLPMKLPPVAS